MSEATRRRRRAVWALISRTPRATIRDISRELGMCVDTAHRHVRALIDLGYVNRPHRFGTGFSVVVPFGEGRIVR